jgi:hypothetical protein
MMSKRMKIVSPAFDAKKNRIARSKENPFRWKRWPLDSDWGVGETMQGWRSGARMVGLGKQMKRASLELQRCPFGKQLITDNRQLSISWE